MKRKPNVNTLTIKQLLNEFSKTHKNKYDYSLVTEIPQTKEKIKIVCPTHGEFNQRYDHHRSGKGCKMCANVSVMVIEIWLYLTNHDVPFETEKAFPGMVFERQQYTDFYLPDINLVIEVQGKQHEVDTSLFWNEKTKPRDDNKFAYLEKNQIPYLVIHHKDDWKNILQPIIDRIIRKREEQNAK